MYSLQHLPFDRHSLSNTERTSWVPNTKDKGEMVVATESDILMSYGSNKTEHVS